MCQKLLDLVKAFKYKQKYALAAIFWTCTPYLRYIKNVLLPQLYFVRKSAKIPDVDDGVGDLVTVVYEKC